MTKRGERGKEAEIKSSFTSNLAVPYPLLQSDDNQNSQKLTCFSNINPLTVLRKSNHNIFRFALSRKPTYYPIGFLETFMKPQGHPGT